MPAPGVGIVPQGGAYAELTAVTRRAFVPKLIVQLYNASPAIAAFIASAQYASGGVSSVSVPVQGSQYVQGQWSDYSGTFAQPNPLQGTSLSEYDLKSLLVPIPFLGMEAAVQLDYAVIPLIEARMNDATNAMVDLMSTALYNNTSNNQQLIGLPGAIDDSTNLVTYGNINRSTNAWWKSKVYSLSNINPTRQLVLQYISGVVKSAGELPTFGLMGVGTWTLLAADFVGQEDYVITPDKGFSETEGSGPRSAFRALRVAGVPIYCDPYCPEGILYLPNTNYISLYIHEKASFAFTGFESTLSNWQLGFVGVLLTFLELVSTKPKAMGRVSGLNSLAI
jgi:hypothetical protein